MTYTQLQADILAGLGNVEVEQQIPVFIRLAEAQMQRRLKVRSMLTTITTTYSAEYDDLPADFAGVRSLELSGTPTRTLAYIDPDGLAQMKAQYATSGRPTHYSIVGSQLRFWPAPSEAYPNSRLTYWRVIPALSGANTTNWLLTQAYDAYLYGALVNAASFLGDKRLTAWAAQFDAALSALEAADHTESYGQGLQVRPNNVA